MQGLFELEFYLPDEEGVWKIVGFDDVEYRNDSVIGWDGFIADKVKKETGLNYPVRESRFNFGIRVQLKSTQRNSRLHCAITIAEQNNNFYVYLEDEDDFLPENSCLDLKALENESLVTELLSIVLKDSDLYQQLEEEKKNYKLNECFDGVRTFRRLQKFIDNGCLFVKILKN